MGRSPHHFRIEKSNDYRETSQPKDGFCQTVRTVLQSFDLFLLFDLEPLLICLEPGLLLIPLLTQNAIDRFGFRAQLSEQFPISKSVAPQLEEFFCLFLI